MRDLAMKMRQDGASHGQIARALNQPRSTVRSWLRRQDGGGVAGPPALTPVDAAHG